MPQLGETVTEGTITKWFKAVGDTVARDEPLFEVSTDKVDSEVPSPAAGVLTAILVEEGDTVDVGAKLAVIGDEASAVGEAPTSSPAPASAPAPARAPRSRTRSVRFPTNLRSVRPVRLRRLLLSLLLLHRRLRLRRLHRRLQHRRLLLPAAPAPPPAASPEPGAAAPLGPSNGPVLLRGHRLVARRPQAALGERDRPEHRPRHGPRRTYHQKRRRECDRCAGSTCGDRVTFRAGTACASPAPPPLRRQLPPHRSHLPLHPSLHHPRRRLSSPRHRPPPRTNRRRCRASWDAPPRLHSVEPRSARNRRAEVRWFGTRSSRSTTSVGEPPSTWFAPRRRHLTH